MARIRIFGRLDGLQPDRWTAEVGSRRLVLEDRALTVEWDGAPPDRDLADEHLRNWVDGRLLALTLRTGRPGSVEWAGASEFDPGDGRLRVRS